MEQDPQRTTVWACEKTVVMLKHPTQSTSNELQSTRAGDAARRTGTLDIHEVRVGRLHQPLELVGLFGGGGRGVEEVNGERLQRERHKS